MYDVPMHANESPVLALRNRQAGRALRKLRESFLGRPGSQKPPSQMDFGVWACAVLHVEPRRGHWWQQMEQGDITIPAALLLALNDEAGMDLEELLSLALHTMVHEDILRITVSRDEGVQRRLQDPARRDRVAGMLERLRELHDLQSRAAGATDRPRLDNS